MATVSVVDASSPLGAAIVLVGAYSGPGGVHLAPGAEATDASLGGQLLAGYRAAGGSGQLDEVIKIATLGLAGFPLVIVAGLGSEADAVDPGARRERLRRGVAAGIRSVSATARVRVCLQPADPQDPLDIAAIAQGAKLGSYRFLEYKTKTAAIAMKTIEVALARPDRSVTAAVRRALVIAEAIMMARDLVNTPPNDLYPQSFAAEIERRSAGVAVELEVLAEDELARQGYLGLLAVGGGSVRAPRLVRLTYRPARSRARVALVGQGTTFNAGGLNLKTVQMSWTKSDLAGAAAAAAAVIAAARLKLPVEVTATMPMAENLPSGTSYRPSDIVTLRGGRTVEVSDTDASGRLTVAEAIVRAVEDEPDYLIEASTLTAAQRVALGPRLIAAMGQPAFRDRVIAAGNDAGESLWAMPLPAELRTGLDSSVADLGNVAPDRWASMLVGGYFLGDFVPKGMPWVHLDIAGPAWNSGGPHGHTPKGGTGAATATMIATLEAIAAG